MGAEIKSIQHLESILLSLAESQVKTQESQAKTQSQVDTLSETLSTLLIKLNQNAERDDMIHNSIQKGKSLDAYGRDIKISRDLSREEEFEKPDRSQGMKGSHDIEYPELRRFAEEGNWETAKSLFKYDSEAVSAVVTEYSHTALHIAANARQWTFVKGLLELMQPEVLALQETKYGYTALHTVVVEGNVEIAKAMVKKNPKLTQIREYNESVPLKVAADYITDTQEEMVNYLWSATTDEEPSPFFGPHGASLLCSLVDANFYDIAICIVQKYPNLVIQESENSKVTALEMMAGRPFTFLSGCKLTLWERWMYSVIAVDLLAVPCSKHMKGDVENPLLSEDSSNRGGIITRFRGTMMDFFSAFQNSLTRVPAGKGIYNKKLMHEKVTTFVKCMLTQLRLKGIASSLEFFENSNVLKTAMKSGTTEFVVECLQTFPELIWHKTKNQRILQVAIEERNGEILNLICKLSGDRKDDLVSRRDENGNNILHYVAKLAPSHQLKLVSGAPLQMQREMQWYKGVENLLPEKYRLLSNKDGNTAQQIFTEEHTKLVREAEDWMKGTSESCMLLTTLIATVAFAAAFTVPGGNISDTNSGNNGIPIFLFNDAFMVFAIADALSLFSSITSVLMFLSILTSRYAEVDFLVSLPRKLIIGLATLFFSLATIMVAFGAALSIVLGHRLAWVTIPVSLFACVPVSSFVFLQFPLFWEIVSSTYWPSIFPRKKQRPVTQNNKKDN
ncbi:hypothetical protein MKW98_006111 [Papaver atlanticum]|uniref:PGG domain-containing protein n=1 Tax=Papaver atlanticum TaxID=357466 RepID=A0AAD4TH00_9MAGN|nr:hypothetical protein MKW98_006111 [Papaver atlanticum]